MSDHVTRVDAGLPRSGLAVAVLHAASVARTVVEFRHPAAPQPRSEPFWRPAGERVYKPFRNTVPSYSYEELAGCDAAVMYACVKAPRIDDKRFGRAIGLARLDLTGEPAIELLELEDLVGPGGWVHALHRASDDGSQLDVTCTFREVIGPRKWVRYRLCRIDLPAHTLTQFDDLPGLDF